MSVTRRIYLCLNVRGFLRQSKFPKGYESVFSRDDGTELSPEQARDFLLDELSKGREVIPCSGKCGNPCQHANKGCTGFDYQGGGCPGHQCDDPKTEAVQ